MRRIGVQLISEAFLRLNTQVFLEVIIIVTALWKCLVTKLSPVAISIFRDYEPFVRLDLINVKGNLPARFVSPHNAV